MDTYKRGRAASISIGSSTGTGPHDEPERRPQNSDNDPDHRPPGWRENYFGDAPRPSGGESYYGHESHAPKPRNVRSISGRY